MRKPETYSCDVCGKQKQSVNHWWLAFGGTPFELYPWTEANAIDADKHLCGAECVIKAVSEWMQTDGR